MKKIIYSNYTKFIAVVLFITSIVLGALTVTNGIAEYGNEKEVIYRFENDFSEARHFSHYLYCDVIPKYSSKQSPLSVIFFARSFPTYLICHASGMYPVIYLFPF